MSDTTKKQASGGARLIACGKKPMLIGWTAEDRDTIERAAKAAGVPMTQFVQIHSIKAARRILRRST